MTEAKKDSWKKLVEDFADAATEHKYWDGRKRWALLSADAHELCERALALRAKGRKRK